MSAITGTSSQTTESLLLEAFALDQELIRTSETSRQRPGSLELISRCNVLLGLMAREGKTSTSESLGRVASTRALLCRAAARLALLEAEAGAVSRWFALVSDQCTELLNQAAASSPSHPIQQALNAVANCLTVVTLVADDSEGTRLRGLLQRCLDRLNANTAVLAAGNELGVDALNDAIVLDGLARQMRLASDRAACLDKAISSCHAAADHFGGVENSEFRSKAENLLRRLVDQRTKLTDVVQSKAAAASLARTVKPSAAVPPAMPRFCGACGAGVQPGWKFCKACGAALQPRDSAAPGGTH